MTQGITEELNQNQLKQFDEESINKMIKQYNETKKLLDFDIDWDSDLSKDELVIYNTLKEKWNVIESLNQLLKLVKNIKPQSENSISDTISHFADYFSSTDKISEKNINKYTKEEAEVALKYINNNYKNYDKAISRTAEKLAENISSTNSLDEIDTDAEANIFQQKLIEKILWTTDGYNSEEIAWYNNEIWHYLVNVWDFFSNIKNRSIKDINSYELINSFKYISKWDKLDILELENIFWKDNLKELKKYWNNNEWNKNKTIAKQYLLDNWMSYIIELMDSNWDYYSSLFKIELEEKLKIVKNPKEKARINIKILQLRINEKKEVIKKIWNKKDIKLIKLIENKYKKDNSNSIFEKLNNIENKESEYTKLIYEITKKHSNLSDGESNKFINMNLNQTLEYLLTIKDIQKVWYIIKGISDRDIFSDADDELSILNQALIDLYINKITKEWSLKQKKETIKNLILFRSLGMCPNSSTVIELKKSLILNNKMRNKIKNYINKIYIKWDNLWDELIREIEWKLNNAKEWKKYCTIDAATIIEKFDKKHLDDKKIHVELTNKEIKDIVNWIMDIKKEKLNLWVSSILKEAAIWITTEDGLAKISEIQIKNLKTINNEQKLVLINTRKEYLQINKSQEFFASTTDEEMNLIRKSIKNWKNPFDIKKEIEKQREEKKKIEEKNETENKNNTKNKISTPYELNTSLEKSTITFDNWTKEIEISNNEANMINSNPKVAENIINFNKTLNDVWLSNLWQYREQISNAIWSISWTNLNNNDDSLNVNELQIFLNSILTSIWEKKIKQTPNMQQFTNLFRIKNDVQIIWNWFKNENVKIWSSNIEEIFMQKYIVWFSKFQTATFQQDIQKKS